MTEVRSELRNSISNNQQGISNVQGKKIWLEIITKAEMIKAASQLIPFLQETDELIAILFTRVETAKKKKGKWAVLSLEIGFECWILDIENWGECWFGRNSLINRELESQKL